MVAQLRHYDIRSGISSCRSGDSTSSRGVVPRCLFRRQQKTPTKIPAITTTPPTRPPTIAPTLTLLPDGLDDADDVVAMEVGELVLQAGEIGTPQQCHTRESDVRVTIRARAQIERRGEEFRSRELPKS